jgi:hypothetical protein
MPLGQEEDDAEMPTEMHEIQPSRARSFLPNDLEVARRLPRANGEQDITAGIVPLEGELEMWQSFDEAAARRKARARSIAGVLLFMALAIGGRLFMTRRHADRFTPAPAASIMLSQSAASHTGDSGPTEL